jgi:hypothetical protein
MSTKYAIILNMSVSGYETSGISPDDFLPPSPEAELRLLTAFESLSSVMSNNPPMEVIEIGPDVSVTVKFLHRKFTDGTQISATFYEAEPSFQAVRDIEGNDIDTMLDSSLLISDAGKEPIEYTRRADGEPKIFIRSLAEQAIRKESSGDPIRASLGAISLQIQGTPEFMDIMNHELQLRADAKRLGVTTPTQGSVQRLAGAIERILPLLEGSADQ